MSRIMLLGASGFLGRWVRHQLAGDPRVAELSCPGRDRLDLLTADVPAMVELLESERPDLVLNCMGRLTGGPAELLRGNAGVVATLVEAMTLVAPRARLVRLGSAAEYGAAEHGLPIREDDPAKPVSMYGVSHLAGTGIVENAPIEAVSLRIFNPVGPGISAQSVLGKAVALLREGCSAIELGPLGALRDFVDVRDVATAVVAAGFADVSGARVFNVGSGRAIAVREPVGMLAREAGFTGEVRESAPESVRSLNVGWSQADIGRAGRLLGWEPRYTLAASVKEMWCASSSP